MTAATHARVTNLNDFPLEDRYDGVPLIFEPDVPKVISLEAAALFFGFPVDDEGNVTFAVDHGYLARRWGWNVLERQDDKESLRVATERMLRQAAERCGKVKVEPVSYTLREVVQGEEELPPPRDPVATAAEVTGEGGQTADEERPVGGRRGKMTAG